MRGKTSRKWYKPSKEMGWSKSQSTTTRRRKALKAHKGSHLSTGRALQSLANVTTDKPTETKARADAKYFFRRHKETKK